MADAALKLKLDLKFPPSPATEVGDPPFDDDDDDDNDEDEDGDSEFEVSPTGLMLVISQLAEAEAAAGKMLFAMVSSAFEFDELPETASSAPPLDFFVLRCCCSAFGGACEINSPITSGSSATAAITECRRLRRS